MAHKLGVSGSTIYSNADKYLELFWNGIEHIEIGEFANEKDLDKFLELYKEREVSVGIHSPVLRTGSKYDLIEKVKYDSEYAWKQLELEAEKMSALGAKYILVHFPYFKEETSEDVNELIESGLNKLKYIKDKYGIEIVCEPKLGLNRSVVGINYLDKFPKDIWEKYNIKLCIDIGDYIIATKEYILDYLSKWSEFIKVVHLHNIEYEGDDYTWIPVHPTQEKNGEHKIQEIIKFLAKFKDVTFIFEHTPETNPREKFVLEGYEWVKELIK